MLSKSYFTTIYFYGAREISTPPLKVSIAGAKMWIMDASDSEITRL